MLPQVRFVYLKRTMAAGDVLVASAVIKALKHKHQGCQLYFGTNVPAVLKNNPEIKKIVSPRVKAAAANSFYYDLDLAYERRPTCNILNAYCQVVGVKPEDCDFFLSKTLVTGLPRDFIVIHAGYSKLMAGRQWSHAKFIQLAVRLKRKHAVVCIGGASDFLVPCNLDLRGKTNINQLAYVIQQARLFVGVDSLPFHVAQFVHTPGVCFFGAIDPLTRIYRKNMHAVFVKGLKCLGCHNRKPPPCTAVVGCETNLFECANNLAVADMFNEIEQRLKEYTMGEVTKAYDRRVRENWFEAYCPEDKAGIDIGCQHDPINHTFRRWDIIFGDSDATFMQGVPDGKFWTVHASHVLEHVHHPVLALQNWYRILKRGGNLIVLVPHRDLYEKKLELPSIWNGDHKSFWLPETAEAPHTRSLKHTILEAIPNAEIISFRVLDENYYSESAAVHSQGEYSIEAVIRKN
jgi:ADP-heptose:LPS heptosyltransferase